MKHTIPLIITILALLATLAAPRTGMAAATQSPSSGAAYGWGANNLGQLGEGSTTTRITPVRVTGLSSAIAIAAGSAHSLAVAADGTVWTWGANNSYQLGEGSTTIRTTPVQVLGLSSVVAVAGGRTHSLALTSDGSVWAWGNNSVGQLGDGSWTNQPRPVQLHDASGVVAIAAGDQHSVALRRDGTVWTWGLNASGQLGAGYPTCCTRSTPIQVSNLTNVIAIASGYDHSLAVKNDGSVWAWGNNSVGQLGDGSTVNRSTPVQVIGLTDVVAVAGGYIHSVALKADGSVWAWGANNVGQLGDGSTIVRFTPVQVSGLTHVVALATGRSHNLAVKSDGSVWAWGLNGNGQLGDGSTLFRVTPVQVSSLSGAVAIAAGGGHSLALAGYTPPAAAPSTPDLAPASDSGASDSDDLTNDTTPTFTGSATAGVTVRILVDGVEQGAGAASDGSYSITTATLGEGAHSISAIATDSSGNVSVPSGGLSIIVDTQAPTATIISTPPAITNNANVQFGFGSETGATTECSLAEDVDAFAACASPQSYGPLTDGAYTFKIRATDAAGNTGAAAAYTFAIDTTSPSIKVSAPTATTYILGQAVAAAYTCAEESSGSGLASCSGTVPDGNSIDTASIGKKSFVVTAADNVGNSASQSVSYTVAYQICPLYDQSKSHRLGSTVAIKLQLCDSANLNTSSADIGVHATDLTKLDGTASAEVEESSNANPDSDFRFDSALSGTGGYVYNLSTRNLSTGTWVLSFVAAGDPTTHTVRFDVR